MKQLANWYSGINLYLKLAPFLVLYLIICIVFAPQVNVGDEKRYLYFANNLINGHYSPPYPGINLWNGPGYPLFIAPFLFLKLPLLGIRLLNGLLLYLSLIINYKTFNFYSTENKSLLLTMALGFYFPIFQMLPLIITETLTWFLVSLICYLFFKNYRQKTISWKFVFLNAFFLAFLAMTKVIFGYVIILMLIFSVIMSVFPNVKPYAKKSSLIYAISFIFCLPYLFYTFNLTNKLFYWTNSGGMSLYTMSTPFSNESGEWKSTGELLLSPNHRLFIDSISKLKPIEIDNAYKKAAFNNIVSHPNKYFKNWIANIGRILFSYPYSNTNQRISTFFTMIPNMFIVFMILFAFVINSLNYKLFPMEMSFFLLFILVYLFGCTLVSSYNRMFFITMPFWFCYINCIINNSVYIRIKRL